MNKSDKSICIYDLKGGSYLNMAQLLSPYFAKTYYFSENKDAFPHPALSAIGTGFDEFERVNDFWFNLNSFDIIVFPDGGCQDIADHLKLMGKKCFGGSHMSDIEESRSAFNELLQRVDLPVPNSITVKGIPNLIKALKTKKNKWIKVSKWRNMVETYNWIDYTSSKFWLDELIHKMGPLADTELVEFIIQDPIDAIAEIGCDGYTLNGQMPEALICGIECKDAGYVGKVTRDIPEPIKWVNDKFATVLKSYKSNGFYSTEIRYTEQKIPYYTDIAARAGMPPSSSYLSNINNWNEIIPSISEGIWCEPKYKSIYMVELILKSNFSKDGYLPVTFPEELAPYITFKGAMKVNGKVFIVPFSLSNIDMVEFGSVVVNDDNLDLAISKALEIADQIQAYEIRYDKAAADSIKEELTRMEEAINYKF